MVVSVVNSDSETSMAPQKGPPIDRGRAWIVMAACFMNMMLCIGYIRSFGIFFFEFLNYYKASSSLTALVMGIQGGMFSVSGFVAQNIMSSYISERWTVMLGGLLFSAGVILSIFANTISLLIAAQSILIGCGNAFIIGSGLVLLSKYFDKHRSFATAVANTGANLGAIIIPPLIRYLLDELGLHGAFLIYGGLVLNVIAFGALMRPIESYACTDGRLRDGERVDPQNCINRVNVPKIIITNPEEESLLSENLENAKSKMELKAIRPEVRRLLSEEVGTRETIRQRSSSTSNRSFTDYLDSYSEKSAVKYSSTPDLACLSTHEMPTSTDLDEIPLKSRSRFVTWLNKTLDFSLFRQALFYLILVTAFFGVMGGAVMGIYLPALAKDKNATDYQATAILSASGAAGVVSRLGVGFSADRGFMKKNQILAVAMLVSGVTGLLAPFYREFWSLLLFSLVYGFFGALYFSLITVIIVDYLGINKLARAFGFLQLVHGVGIAAAHPICGLLRDITGNFDAAYQFFGTACLLSSVLLLLEPCARRFDERNAKKEEQGK